MGHIDSAYSERIDRCKIQHQLSYITTTTHGAVASYDQVRDRRNWEMVSTSSNIKGLRSWWWARQRITCAHSLEFFTVELPHAWEAPKCAVLVAALENSHLQSTAKICAPIHANNDEEPRSTRQRLSYYVKQWSHSSWAPSGILASSWMAKPILMWIQRCYGGMLASDTAAVTSKWDLYNQTHNLDSSLECGRVVVSKRPAKLLGIHRDAGVSHMSIDSVSPRSTASIRPKRSVFILFVLVHLFWWTVLYSSNRACWV